VAQAVTAEPQMTLKARYIAGELEKFGSSPKDAARLSQSLEQWIDLAGDGYLGVRMSMKLHGADYVGTLDASDGTNLPLRSSASSSSQGAIFVPRQNIPTGEVTMQELLADATRIPGSQGAYLNVQPGEAIRFTDLYQLASNQDGAEFMLSREVMRNGNQVARRWRIYSGTPDQIPPPRFFDPNAPGGGTRIERIVGHTHFENGSLIFTQPSQADLDYLGRIAGDWHRLHGPPEPFGQIIWGTVPGQTTQYGMGSTAGHAVPPPWFERTQW
jgi:hypothetical protein